MTDLKPALTPSEWEDCELAYPTVSLTNTSGVGADLVIWDGGDNEESDSVRISLPRERHAVAALALYRQPYGFTHDDLMDLALASSYLQPKDPLTKRLESLIQRVAALLPPHPVMMWRCTFVRSHGARCGTYNDVESETCGACGNDRPS